eukprot:TRINITY_DN5963_c0_g1_i1.p1 TRINITY_DN5963_c0_g1~~TRINITY_DN5963_c0_g1_i1.p1  ORF type:complete len:303 (-),score=177.65 TRINITY_DN5963_c0_g1_i1:194-1102(-)
MTSKRSGGSKINEEDGVVFEELLSNESRINMAQLREAAADGVVAAVRGEVYKLLLGVSDPDKSQEMSTGKQQQQEFMALNAQRKYVDARVRSAMMEDLREYTHNSNPQVAAHFRAHVSQQRFAQVLLTFLGNQPHVAYSPRLVHMLVPFVYCQQHRADMYYSFVRLLTLVRHHTSSQQLKPLLARFMMLFRAMDAELCTYLEDEDLSPNAWAIPWFKQLLAGCLPLEPLLRLWDTYFALGKDKFMSLHMYVCLSILRTCREDLMELEHSEIRHFLAHLPAMNMDRILAHAYNIRDELAHCIP